MSTEPNTPPNMSIDPKEVTLNVLGLVWAIAAYLHYVSGPPPQGAEQAYQLGLVVAPLVLSGTNAALHWYHHRHDGQVIAKMHMLETKAMLDRTDGPTQL